MQLTNPDTSGYFSPGQGLRQSQHLPPYLAQSDGGCASPAAHMFHSRRTWQGPAVPWGLCGMAISGKGRPNGCRRPHYHCWYCQQNPSPVNTDQGPEDKISPINKIEVDTKHIRMSLLQGACKICLFNRTNNISYHQLSGDSVPVPLPSALYASSQSLLTITPAGECNYTFHFTAWRTEVPRSCTWPTPQYWSVAEPRLN